MANLEDKNNMERSTVVGNPRYPGNIDRRAIDLPFSMIVLDRKEVGIELIQATNPKNFNGVIIVRDEKIVKLMTSYYQKMRESIAMLP